MITLRAAVRAGGYYWVRLSHGRARWGEKWGGATVLDVAYWSEVGWEIIGSDDGCVEEDVEVVSGPLILPVLPA